MRMRVPRGQTVPNQQQQAQGTQPVANNLLNVSGGNNLQQNVQQIQQQLQQNANNVQQQQNNTIKQEQQQTNKAPDQPKAQQITGGTLFANSTLNQVAGMNNGQAVQVTVKNGQIVNQQLQQRQNNTMVQQSQTNNTATNPQQQLQFQIAQQQQNNQQQQSNTQQNIQQLSNFITNANNPQLVMASSSGQNLTLQQKAQVAKALQLQQQQKANELQLIQQRLRQQAQPNIGFNNMGNIDQQQQQQQQNMSNNQPQPNATQPLPNNMLQQQQQQQAQQNKIINTPSPSQQMQPSPAAYNQPVPSPANPLSSIGPSPSPLNSTDEMLYQEKLVNLRKYVEPLNKMLQKTPKDEEHHKEREKLRGLLDILTNSRRRVKLQILTQCEAVLKRLIPSTPNSAGPTSMKTPEPFDVSVNTPARPAGLQPMGEVVTNVITSANLMAETRQNILPGMYALNVPMISPPAPPVRNRARPKPYEQPKKTISLPRALQMEIVNLTSNRFSISLDKTKPMDSEGMTIRCKYNNDLVASHLGTLLIQVSSGYPRTEPSFSFLDTTQPSTQDLSSRMTKKLSRLPHTLTFTAILLSWEQSLVDCFGS
ncbi:mediator of RNA polymerase II transcription subunit 15-like isoform X2 [Clytia hemisphaerica]|uniref:mediator of RNA polymerase II transcription subunit 15-like isoform X2 n=1 Tax=Clytia hemisphaerica TaxID=252671 RepID=UPI0034D65456